MAGTNGCAENAVGVPFERDIKLIYSNTWLDTWDIFEADCTTAYDFTNHILEFKIETLSYGRDILVLTQQAGIDSSTAGKLIFTITAAQSELINAGTYQYTFKVTYPTNIVETWSYGTFKIKRGNKD